MRIQIVIMFFILQSCNSFKGEFGIKRGCQLEIDNLAKNLDESDMAKLYGLTLEGRGRDNKGRRMLRNLTFTDEFKEQFVVPSFQSLGENENLDLSKYDIAEFTKLKKIEIKEIERFANSLVNLYDKLDVRRIHSQLHLGEFIEFELGKGCSVWYKKENAHLNENYKIFFSEGRELLKNWFIIQPRRLAPVLKEHPSNMKI